MSTSYDRSGARVALVTCAELADLDPGRPAAACNRWRRWGSRPSRRSGTTRRSTGPRTTSSCCARRGTTPRAARRVPGLGGRGCRGWPTRPSVVRWNTDKRYLSALAAAGVPVVPTDWVEPSDAWALPAAGEWVIKPAVSAGSLDTGRYASADPAHRDAGARRTSPGCSGRAGWSWCSRTCPRWTPHGETSLLFLGGAYSHAIRKGPMLAGPDERRRGPLQGGGHHAALAVARRTRGRRRGAGGRAVRTICCTRGWTSSPGRTGSRCSSSWSSPSRRCSSAPPTARPTACRRDRRVMMTGRAAAREADSGRGDTDREDDQRDGEQAAARR